MLATYTLDTLLVKFEVGAKPRARDPRLYALGYCTTVAASAPASLGIRIGVVVVGGGGVVVHAAAVAAHGRVYLRGRGWGTRACGYEKG